VFWSKACRAGARGIGSRALRQATTQAEEEEEEEEEEEVVLFLISSASVPSALAAWKLSLSLSFSLSGGGVFVRSGRLRLLSRYGDALGFVITEEKSSVCLSSA
jgi:hypothetical protein